MYKLCITLTPPGSVTDLSRPSIRSTDLTVIRNRLTSFFTTRSISASIIDAKIVNNELLIEIAVPETISWFQNLCVETSKQNTFRGSIWLYDEDNEPVAEAAILNRATESVVGKFHPIRQRRTLFNTNRG